MGRGGGWGGGGGRGYRHWFYATGLTGWQRAQMGCAGPAIPPFPVVSGDQEAAALRQQAAGLEQVLAELRARISELETNVASSNPSTAKEQG